MCLTLYAPTSILASLMHNSPLSEQLGRNGCDQAVTTMLYRPAKGKPLTFSYRNLGCLDAACGLCLQNPQRRCSDSCFAPKYLMFDPLKAKCGASIRLDVVSSASGAPVPQALIGDVCLKARSAVDCLS